MPALSPAEPDLCRQVDTLHQQAHRLRHEDARQALQLCRQAHALALRLDYQRGLAWSLLRLSLCQTILGLADEDPRNTLHQALGLMRSLGDQQGEAEALNLLGNLHLAVQAHDDALACHQQCLALRRQLGDRAGEAGSLHNLSLTHRDRGQLPEALEHAWASLQLAEALQDGACIAYALNSLGSLHSQLGDQPQALALFERALALVRETADRALESTLRINLGRLLSDADEPGRALPHLRTAFDLAQGTGNLGDTALALLALGLLQQQLGAFDVAAPLLADALVLARRLQDRGLAAQLLLAQARAPMQARQPGAALPLMAQALQAAEAAHDLPLIALAHEQLSQAHEARGDLAAALQHARQHHQAVQRLHGPQAERRIRALMSQQATAQARQDVQTERLRNLELAGALAAAQAAEQGRDRLLAELQAQAALLQQLAREDGLTGVANRRWLDLQLQRELDRARRFGHPLAVAMVDIDHFKAVNDGFSHAVGDAALRQVARLLQDGCRSSDVVGRYGGEEFLLVLVETPADAAAGLCDKLRQRIGAHAWADLQPGLPALTVSIGVAALAPGDDPARLLARADAQLYRAKHGGRNRVCA